MSYHKFKKNDIFYNRIKAHPEVRLAIHSGSVYYNSRNMESGAFADPVTHVQNGRISLYELNVDRPEDGMIYPFVTKDGSLTSFSTVSTESFNNDFLYGEEITGSYPLYAKVSRDYIPQNSSEKKLSALKNTLNYYKSLSRHFEYSGEVSPPYSRDLDSTNVNLITIPSIFYGSKIDPGTVNLKFYVTGTLVGEARDERRNGELIQTGPPGSPGSGSVVGITLYNEGFMLLTASHSLSTHTEAYAPLAIPSSPSWVNFATTGSLSINAPSSSFNIDFKGTTYTPTITMLAHAEKAKLNYSSNLTFLDHSDYNSREDLVSSTSYKEPEILIKNTVKSVYNDPTASFEKQVYISRVGIYDEDKNLIAVAKLATPIRKREDEAVTIKLKLDI